jgi:hypothetical protein
MVRGRKSAEAGSMLPTPMVALAAWMVPGLGHWLLGERGRGLVFLVVICVTFWGGVAVGGVRSTVTPKENGAWIAAQLCAGPQALAAMYLGKADQSRHGDRHKAPWPASNIAVVYAGIAGLLNLLVIIDTLSRSEARQVSAVSRGPPARQER